MRVCARLSIPFQVFSFQEVFRSEVVDYFCRSYRQGQTPNPCIACNRFLKWGAMRSRAAALGIDQIATGHYAGIARLENGRFAIRRSKYQRKDQSYVLYSLTQEDLAHTLMPLGDYEKDEVRAIAAEVGLEVAKKPDSQDICFVPDGDYASFLERENGESAPGDFLLDGQVVGRHKGITHYTIGQRKGLGIAVGRPVFVNRIDVENNTVVLGSDEECFRSTLIACDLNHMAVERFDPEAIYTARIRYSDTGTSCRVRYLDADRIEVTFLKPVRAVTPGQALVLDDGAWIAGGGRIVE